MKVLNPKIVKRWNGIMYDIGLEFMELPTFPGEELFHSEIIREKRYYNVLDGVTYGWMKREAEYWLSCYYERGHCRCDDRFGDPDYYKVWVSETGKLKRFIKALEKYEQTELVIDWEEKAIGNESKYYMGKKVK